MLQGEAPPPLQAEDALFLDFDGTLAGLQDNPDTVFLAPGMAAVLEAGHHTAKDGGACSRRHTVGNAQAGVANGNCTGRSGWDEP